MPELAVVPLVPLPCRPRTGINYALATLYLLVSILILVLAFALPNLTTTDSIAFALVGGVLFVAAIVHIAHVSIITRPAPAIPPPLNP